MTSRSSPWHVSNVIILRSRTSFSRSESSCRLTSCTRKFSRLQGRLDDAGDARSDLVLKFEDIFEQAVEAIGPQMRSGVRVDQLSGDADPIAALAHRAFEHVADTQFATDPLHVDVLALVGEARIAGGYKQPADAGEGGDDLLDHAVGKIFLLRVAAQIVERQHR